MNKLSVAAVASVLLAVAGAAFADDITPDPYRDTPAVKTRQQVQAELAQAQQDGSIKVWSTAYNPFKDAPSVKTRAEVVAELKAARASGEYDALNSEDGGALAVVHAPKQRDSSRTLAQAR